MRWSGTVVLLVALTACHPGSSASPPPGAKLPTPASIAPLAPQTEAPADLLARLVTDPSVRRRLLGRQQPKGTVLCGINVLGETEQEEYAWLSCGDFRTGAGAALLSGGAGPAVITATTVRFPRAAHYYEDVGAMFPPELVDKVKQAGIAVTPTQRQLVEVARGLPARPECRVAELDARHPDFGGAAGGTYYLDVELTNDGPDCVLTTGGLALWAGGSRVATLDLADHQGLVPLPAGWRFMLHAYVPNQDCAIADRSGVELALSDGRAAHALLPVTGTHVPSAYARCAGVGLSAAGRRATPSR